MYRAVAFAVLEKKVDIADFNALQNLINHINIKMQSDEIGSEAKIFCDNQDITNDIRSEICGQMASKISAIPLVRAALLGRQRTFRQSPGLVTDGRDMGTVVFPDAILKFYLTASVTVRAERRYHQLKQKGQHVSLRDVLLELQARDERDLNRAISPAKPADDVILIDTTHLDVEGVLQEILRHGEKNIGGC